MLLQQYLLPESIRGLLTVHTFPDSDGDYDKTLRPMDQVQVLVSPLLNEVYQVKVEWSPGPLLFL